MGAMESIRIGVMSLMRLFANHCPSPSLRMHLFRLSGVQIGRKVMINMDTKFIDNWRPGFIIIEDEVSMGPFVSLVAEAMPNNSFIGEVYDVAKEGRIILRRGAWLGVGVVVLPGVEIGSGAIVGANAVVTCDVEPFAIMAGAPARKIGDVRDKRKKAASQARPGECT